MTIKKYPKKVDGSIVYELWYVKSIRVKRPDGSSYATKEKVEFIGLCSDLEKANPDYLNFYKQKAKSLDNSSIITLNFHTGERRSVDNSSKLKSLGYIFPQAIYYALNIDKSVNKRVKQSTKATFDFNRILRDLVISNILMPASKRKVFEDANDHFLEKPDYIQEHIYRFLSYACKHMDNIIKDTYLNIEKAGLAKRDIIYYDCTNYYFEIEEDDGLDENGKKKGRQYGKSKENRPNPLVLMGLFMDSHGFPVGVCLEEESKNEQTTLIPGQKVLDKFGITDYVICTDAGLKSIENMKNNTHNKGFICVATLKTKGRMKIKPLTKAEKDEVERKNKLFDEYNWRRVGDKSGRLYTLSEIKQDIHIDETFYKEDVFHIDNKWKDINGDINHPDNFRRLIVTFRYKYYLYQRELRARQIDRAKKLLDSGEKLDKSSPNSPKRFIKMEYATSNGEACDQSMSWLDTEKIAEEEKWDGYYGLNTNLRDDVAEIIRVNSYRQEIENSFRVMKSDLKARPAHLSREERIKSHFFIKTLSLSIYRVIERLAKQENEEITKDEILKAMRSYLISDEKKGYIGQMEMTTATKAIQKGLNLEIDREAYTSRMIQSMLKKAKRMKIKDGKMLKPHNSK